MGIKIKGSHLIALLFAGGLAAWMYTGNASIGREDKSDPPPPISELKEDGKKEPFKIRYLPLQEEVRKPTLLIRGRTSADAVIPIRAETSGVLEARFVDKGDRVKKGDLVCRIEPGIRAANVAQAKAQLAQAEVEYNASKALNKKGFATRNRLTALKAGVDAARAGLAAAEQEFERTNVHANADGLVQDPVAQVGDMLSPGAACITLVDKDPMLFTGQISERDVGNVKKGMPASIKMIDGQSTDGHIRYIAQTADPSTRTFTLEIELSSSAGIRDGMTAEAKISLEPKSAFRVSPSWLTLGDDGTIGIRTVTEENLVAFVPISILAQEKEGFWITGPQAGTRIITLGQEFVAAGETVAPQLDDRIVETVAQETASKATSK